MFCFVFLNWKTFSCIFYSLYFYVWMGQVWAAGLISRWPISCSAANRQPIELLLCLLPYQSAAAAEARRLQNRGAAAILFVFISTVTGSGSGEGAGGVGRKSPGDVSLARLISRAQSGRTVSNQKAGTTRSGQAGKVKRKWWLNLTSA